MRRAWLVGLHAPCTWGRAGLRIHADQSRAPHESPPAALKGRLSHKLRDQVCYHMWSHTACAKATSKRADGAVAARATVCVSLPSIPCVLANMHSVTFCATISTGRAGKEASKHENRRA